MKRRIARTSIALIAACLLAAVLLVIPYDRLSNIGIGTYRITLVEHDRIGEFIGGVIGVVFSILAAFLLYWTYLKQREEHRIFLERSEAQSAENRFFHLMSMLESITRSLSERYSTEDFFRDKLNEFRNLNEVDMIPGLFDPMTIHQKVVHEFKHFYERYINGFGSWFRMLNQIIYFVNRLKDDEREFYYSILTSSLSEAQIIFFHYYIQAYYSADEKDRIRPYRLLENLQGYLLPEFANVVSFDQRMRDSLSRNESDTHTLVERGKLSSSQDNLCRLVKLMRKYPNTTHSHIFDSNVSVNFCRDGFGFTINLIIKDVQIPLSIIGFNATLKEIDQKTVFNLLRISVVHAVSLRIDANSLLPEDYGFNQYLLPVGGGITLRLTVQPRDRNSERLLYGMKDI